MRVTVRGHFSTLRALRVTIRGQFGTLRTTRVTFRGQFSTLNTPRVTINDHRFLASHEEIYGVGLPKKYRKHKKEPSPFRLLSSFAYSYPSASKGRSAYLIAYWRSERGLTNPTLARIDKAAIPKIKLGSLSPVWGNTAAWGLVGASAALSAVCPWACPLEALLLSFDWSWAYSWEGLLVSLDGCSGWTGFSSPACPWDGEDWLTTLVPTSIISSIGRRSSAV